MELIAVNQAIDWNIEKLVLTGPESTLTVKEGVWQGWALQPKVNLKDIKLEIGDVGKYLERMGYRGTVRRGTAQLEGDLAWAGSPQSLDYATLSGNLLLNAQSGQFLKAEPGAAKLIGILSLQSLITLDFRELFGRGFAVNSISTRATITNGVLSTKEFHMQGPSAEVSMDGEVDLNRETQDLHVRVKPSGGNSMSSIVAMTASAGFKVAVVQMVSTPRVEENLAAAAKLVARAAKQGAKLIALPEYFCILGMRDTDKVAAREKDGAGPIQEFLSGTAKPHRVWLVGGSVPLDCTDSREG